MRISGPALLASLALQLAACTPSSSGGTVAVRVFKTETDRQNIGEFTRTTYEVIARDGPISRGGHLLTLTRDSVTDGRNTPEIRIVFLSDGRGTFLTTEYRSNGDERPVFSEWRSGGAVAVSAVTIQAEPKK